MKKYFEPIIQVLFLMLSIIGSFVHSDAYASSKVYEELFLSNIINVAVIGVYLVARGIQWNRNHLESLQRGMLLYVIYSCLPVFFLMTIPVTKILSAVCFLGALVLWIMKNLDSTQNNWSGKEMKSGQQIAFSLPVFVFGVGFLARGINVVVSYTKGLTEVTEMLVSVSDILISIIWIAVAVGIVRKSSFGAANILACYIQASLLFIGLIAFLLINPLIFNQAMDFESVIVILIMGLFFFIPTVLLVKKKGYQ